MNPTRLMTLTATVTDRTAGGEDEHGNPTWGTATRTILCEIQQNQRAELTDRGPIVVEGWLLFAPPGSAIHAQDTLTAGGVTYEVDGPPWEARNPRTRTVTHVEADLRRVG